VFYTKHTFLQECLMMDSSGTGPCELACMRVMQKIVFYIWKNSVNTCAIFAKIS
jgi:hypothetical protein